jgi:molybdopterin converting factor small subunit
MRVKIRAKFFAMPRDYQGEREIKEKLDKRFIILINGRNYKKVLEDKGKLEQGDNLAFVPFLGGG